MKELYNLKLTEHQILWLERFMFKNTHCVAVKEANEILDKLYELLSKIKEVENNHKIDRYSNHTLNCTQDVKLQYVISKN